MWGVICQKGFSCTDREEFHVREEVTKISIGFGLRTDPVKHVANGDANADRVLHCLRVILYW